MMVRGEDLHRVSAAPYQRRPRYFVQSRTVNFFESMKTWSPVPIPFNLWALATISTSGALAA